MRELLAPFVGDFSVPDDLYSQLGKYLDLLVLWNGRTNLTAVREPEEMVTRHFGESIFAARQAAKLLQAGDPVLDFGSGGGFPGVPLQLALPSVRVTLGESQNKKATFLREVVRTLGLKQTAVHAGRVEAMPAAQMFRMVTMRAVDDPQLAAEAARTRVAAGGWLLSLHGGEPSEGSAAIPGSERRYVSVEQV